MYITITAKQNIQIHYLGLSIYEQRIPIMCSHILVYLSLQIASVNDAPTINAKYDAKLSTLSTALVMKLLPHVPYNTTTHEGFAVETLAGKFFEDKDNLTQTLGLALFGAQSHISTGIIQLSIY